MTAAVLTIDIVSDVVCPWCYIGKRKLEAALALPGAASLPAVELRWHPFQLNPDIPAEGISRQQYLEDKFGGAQRASEIYERVRAAGRVAGLELNIDGIRLQPNTLAAHALIAFAQRAGGVAANDVKERLFKAYFVENRFIGSADVLTEIAREAGLDTQAAHAFLQDSAQLKAVSDADVQARGMGVSGVPFFIFNHKLTVSGAQEPVTLLAAMHQAADVA